jgi:hypothetical protein
MGREPAEKRKIPQIIGRARRWFAIPDCDSGFDGRVGGALWLNFLVTSRSGLL